MTEGRDPRDHDDHAQSGATLGPIDLPSWGAAVLGIALGLAVAVALAASIGFRIGGS